MMLITKTDLDEAFSESDISDVFHIPEVRTEEINKFILLLRYFFRMPYGINQHTHVNPARSHSVGFK